MENVDEINKLKEELEIRDNAIEHFRKEAIRWANIANDCIKDLNKITELCKNTIDTPTVCEDAEIRFINIGKARIASKILKILKK